MFGSSDLAYGVPAADVCITGIHWRYHQRLIGVESTDRRSEIADMFAGDLARLQYRGIDCRCGRERFIEGIFLERDPYQTSATQRKKEATPRQPADSNRSPPAYEAQPPSKCMARRRRLVKLASTNCRICGQPLVSRGTRTLSAPFPLVSSTTRGQPVPTDAWNNRTRSGRRFDQILPVRRALPAPDWGSLPIPESPCPRSIAIRYSTVAEAYSRTLRPVGR